MKVAYVFGAFPVYSETFGVNEVRSLRDAGVHVDVYRLQKGNRPEGAEEDCRAVVPARRSWVRAVCRALPLAFFALGNASTLKEKLRGVQLSWQASLVADSILNQGYDVVHLFWAHYPALVARALLQRSAETRPLISVFCGAYDLTSQYGLATWSMRYADVLFTHCKANVPEVTARSGRVPEVVYRGVNLCPPVQRGECGDLRFVVVSRLTKSKRVALALDVFLVIAERYPSATLEIVGDGPERRALEHKALSTGSSQRVRFHGYLPHEQVLKVLAGSDVLLLFSHSPSERLPNVVKEAMMVGCIPIVSRSPGLEELIDDGVGGFIVDEPKQRVSHFVLGCVDRLKKQRSELARSARLKIESDFDNRRLAAARVRAWVSHFKEGRG